MSLIKAEYIWIDGTEPTPKLRSKTKILDAPVKKLDEIPEWGYDGSSTYQATGHFSDLLLRPVKALPYDARVLVRVSLAARSAAGMGGALSGLRQA